MQKKVLLLVIFIIVFSMLFINYRYIPTMKYCASRSLNYKQYGVSSSEIYYKECLKEYKYGLKLPNPDWFGL